MNRQDLMFRARDAKSPEEIMQIAQTGGIAMPREGAQAMYDRFHREGMLSDDELDNVSGGCGKDDEEKNKLHCFVCNGTDINVSVRNAKIGEDRCECRSCGTIWVRR